jgi:hypothetical protein
MERLCRGDLQKLVCEHGIDTHRYAAAQGWKHEETSYV